MNNSKAQDNGARLIFGNATLCSQLLRDYSGLDILKDVRAEDIEDVTECFLPMFTEERDADVVKKVHLSDGSEMFVVTLIDHKSTVDYNVAMQLLRYMVFIWEDYEKQMEAQHRGIAKTKEFRYPPILPIVYYDGRANWTAEQQFRDRIFLNEVFDAYVPRFCYKLIQLNSYTKDEILGKNDELALVVLVNRLKQADEFKQLNLPDSYLKQLSEKAPQDVLEVISRVIAVLLRRIQVPEEEIDRVTDRIKERAVGELFADFEDYSVVETRREAAMEKLIEMVCRKLQKGKGPQQIAEDLDEPLDQIETICKTAEIFAPDYDKVKIYKAMIEDKDEAKQAETDPLE